MGVGTRISMVKSGGEEDEGERNDSQVSSQGP